LERRSQKRAALLRGVRLRHLDAPRRLCFGIEGYWAIYRPLRRKANKVKTPTQANKGLEWSHPPYDTTETAVRQSREYDWLQLGNTGAATLDFGHMGEHVKMTAVPTEKERENSLRIMELYDDPGGGY
jgi:hypothetical protein